MSAPKKVFGIILAGGEGKRLMPLTADRAKPAVPFGGQYRLIDFAISNLINSGLRQVVVLTQYKSHSLDRHVSQNWRMSALLDSYVTSVPAQQRLGKRWFSGSADAILQSLNLILDEKPDIVVVIGADHVYRMDFQQMVDAHIASGASATVAGIRQPLALASQFGVIDADPETGRIREFLEKPTDPTGLADSPNEVLVSMGNYVFDTDALIAAVEAERVTGIVAANSSRTRAEVAADLDHAAAATPERGVDPPAARRLRAYALAILAGTDAPTEPTPAQFALRVPQSLAAAWSLSATAETARFEEWIVCTLERAELTRTRWEAAAAFAGCAVESWAAVAVLRAR